MPTSSLCRLLTTSMDQTLRNTHLIHDVGSVRLESNYILIKIYTWICGWCWIWQREKAFVTKLSLVLKISFLHNRFAQNRIFLNRRFTFSTSNWFHPFSSWIYPVIWSSSYDLDLSSSTSYVCFTLAKLVLFMFSWPVS